MTSQRDHILYLVGEHGAAIRDEMRCAAITGRADDARAARELQHEYVADVSALLTVPEPSEPDPIVMRPTVAARIINALKGLRP